MIDLGRTVRAAGVLATIAALAAVTACSSSDAGTGAAGGPATSAAQPAAAGPVAGVLHLDPAAFADAVAKPGTVLLDVRTAAEFAAGHLANAVNLDMQAADFPAQLAKLDKAASYALYCRTGHRSGLAADQMRAAGFASVVDLAGGITAWQAAGRPVTGT